MSEQEPSQEAMEAAGTFIFVEWDSGAPLEAPEEDDCLNFYVGKMGVNFEGEDEEAREMHQILVSDLAHRFDAFAADAIKRHEKAEFERKEEERKRLNC
jgi:hypothetical protein